jgi:hypothetical protein
MGKPEQGEKKPEQHQAKPEGSAKSGKGAAQGPGMCAAQGCKHMPSRFSFCDEHYDHFKFGLIKKDGQLVPDYEKKLGHYLAYKTKRGTHKVA